MRRKLLIPHINVIDVPKPVDETIYGSLNKANEKARFDSNLHENKNAESVSSGTNGPKTVGRERTVTKDDQYGLEFERIGRSESRSSEQVALQAFAGHAGFLGIRDKKSWVLKKFSKLRKLADTAWRSLISLIERSRYFRFKTVLHTVSERRGSTKSIFLPSPIRDFSAGPIRDFPAGSVQDFFTNSAQRRKTPENDRKNDGENMVSTFRDKRNDPDKSDGTSNTEKIEKMSSDTDRNFNNFGEKRSDLDMELLANLCREVVAEETARSRSDIFRLESMRRMGTDIVLYIADSIDRLYEEAFSHMHYQWNNRCEYCHRTCKELAQLGINGGKLTRDHIIPKSLGGTRNKANVAYVCQECNIAKRNLLPWEWIRRLSKSGREIDELRAVNMGLAVELMLHKLGVLHKMSASMKVRMHQNGQFDMDAFEIREILSKANEQEIKKDEEHRRLAREIQKTQMALSALRREAAREKREEEHQERQCQLEAELSGQKERERQVLKTRNKKKTNGKGDGLS